MPQILKRTETRMLHRLRFSPFVLLLMAIFCHLSLSAEQVAVEAPVASDSPTPSMLKLSGMFGDRMVLQRETSAAIWGRANPGATVSVKPSWADQTHDAIVNADGQWQTKIPTPRAGGPFHINVTSGTDSVTLKDVLVGEVWICSGQSNMQWKMRGFGLQHFKDDVDKAKYPNIRFCDVPQVLALQDQNDVRAKWSTCSPQSVLGFSAVGYFFGSRLHQELDVPIGLVSTNWGGSSAEAWVSPDVLRKQFPEFDTVLDGYAAAIEQTGVLYSRSNKAPKGLRQTSPALLYHSMIHPLIPFSFKGVIWYQGESNVKLPLQYRKLFPAMIGDWRARWGNGDFPFYFVQIAPFAYKTNPVSAAYLREAQTMALSVPNTGMVVTMDIGNPDNIHPKQKKPVGERLALLALKRNYGRTDIVDSGPMYSAHAIEGSTIRLRFKDIGSGLIASDAQPLAHFTIAGDDQTFVEAIARIDGETIVVQSENIAQPVAVRFAWGSGDTPNLSNKEGLPASSFRTDQWPVE